MMKLCRYMVTFSLNDAGGDPDLFFKGEKKNQNTEVL